MTATLNPYEVANYILLTGDGMVFSYKTNELKLVADLFEASVSTLSTPFFASRDFVMVSRMVWEAKVSEAIVLGQCVGSLDLSLSFLSLLSLSLSTCLPFLSRSKRTIIGLSLCLLTSPTRKTTKG
jgi:hypothetical protein